MEVKNIFVMMERNLLDLVRGYEEDWECLLNLKRSRQQVIYNGHIDGRMLNGEDGASGTSQCNGSSKREHPSMPPDADWPRDATWLTPNEEKIWAVVVSDRWMSAQEISEKTGIPRDKELEFTLRHLTERKLLESAIGRGYRRRDDSSPLS